MGGLTFLVVVYVMVLLMWKSFIAPLIFMGSVLVIVLLAFMIWDYFQMRTVKQTMLNSGVDASKIKHVFQLDYLGGYPYFATKDKIPVSLCYDDKEIYFFNNDAHIYEIPFAGMLSAREEPVSAAVDNPEEKYLRICFHGRNDKQYDVVFESSDAGHIAYLLGQQRDEMVR